MNPLRHALLLLLRLYQVLVSPVLVLVFGPMGWGCRYHPTCSHYAMQAIREHGTWRGGWLTLRRLGRCQPWGGCGDDPVPPRHSTALTDCTGRKATSLRHGS